MELNIYRALNNQTFLGFDPQKYTEYTRVKIPNIIFEENTLTKSLDNLLETKQNFNRVEEILEKLLENKNLASHQTLLRKGTSI